MKRDITNSNDNSLDQYYHNFPDNDFSYVPRMQSVPDQPKNVLIMT